MQKEIKIMNYSLLYNPEIQGDFLETIRKTKSQSTYIAYYRHLVKIGEYEKLKGKNLYEFGRDEDIAMLKNLWITSFKTANPIRAVCKKYVDYALLVRGLGRGNINPFNSIKSKDYREVVKHSQQKKKYVTPNEYKGLVGSKEIKNSMDKALIVLSYNGIMGKAMTDMINLRRKHIDVKDNTVIVPSTGEIIQIEKWEMSILVDSLNQTEYGKGAELVDSDYIIRPSMSHRFIGREDDINDYCSKATINGRLWKVLSSIVLGGEGMVTTNGKQNPISATALYHSNIAYQMIQLEDKINRKLKFVELREELKLYNIHSQGYTIANAMEIIRKKLTKEEKQIKDKTLTIKEQEMQKED